MKPKNFHIIENKKIRFQGIYSNIHNCYIPHIGENLLEDGVNLYAPLYNLQAILEFANLFPCSNLEEQKAFIKVGYPLLEINTMYI